VDRPLAFAVSQVHRLVHVGRTRRTATARSPKRTCFFALSCALFIPLPHFSPGRRGAGSLKSMGSPLGWFESHFRTAKSNLDALNTIDLGP
jgi:hypothetical protein